MLPQAGRGVKRLRPVPVAASGRPFAAARVRTPLDHPVPPDARWLGRWPRRGACVWRARRDRPGRGDGHGSEAPDGDGDPRVDPDARQRRDPARHAPVLRRLPGRGDRPDRLRQPRLPARGGGLPHRDAGGVDERDPCRPRRLRPVQPDRAHRRDAARLALADHHREHGDGLRHRLARYARRPVGHRSAAADARHDRRLLEPLRHRLGQSGPDRGPGGKYLLLPPG